MGMLKWHNKARKLDSVYQMPTSSFAECTPAMPQFSLQTALEVRERLEKLKQKEFAEQLQVSQEISQKIATHQEAIQQSTDNLNQLKNQGFTIAQLQFYERFRQRTESQVHLLETQLQEQKEVVAVKQKNLLKATQARRVLEILKAKEAQRHRQKQDRMERLEMDEIAQNFMLNQKSS